jgi:hypothetical protein
LIEPRIAGHWNEKNKGIRRLRRFFSDYGPMSGSHSRDELALRAQIISLYRNAPYKALKNLRNLRIAF